MSRRGVRDVQTMILYDDSEAYRASVRGELSLPPGGSGAMGIFQWGCGRVTGCQPEVIDLGRRILAGTVDPPCDQRRTFFGTKLRGFFQPPYRVGLG